MQSVIAFFRVQGENSSFRQGLPESRCHGRQLDAPKCLIQELIQPAVSHPCGLDSGNPCRNDGPKHRFDSK